MTSGSWQSLSNRFGPRPLILNRQHAQDSGSGIKSCAPIARALLTITDDEKVIDDDDDESDIGDILSEWDTMMVEDMDSD